jgi:hypothetical protein
MDNDALEQARQRIAAAAEDRTEPADVAAALERARNGIEALAQTASDLEASLPARVGEAVQEGMRAEALPVARQLAEVRGLSSQLVRRLERIEGDLLAERHARVDDLALIVELISSSWQAAEDRLERIERSLQPGGGAVVYRMEERRPASG